MKLFFSQAAAVLFDRVPALEELRTLFADSKTVDSPVSERTKAFNGPGLLVTGTGEKEIAVEVDIQDGPWPDTMASSDPENALLAAASLGAYGAGVEPGHLATAVQQAWHWKEAAAETGRHSAFIRLRTRGAMLSGDSANGSPAPLEELNAILRIAVKVMSLPGSVAWFNPAGQVVMSPPQFNYEFIEAASLNRPAINALSAVRICKYEDWLLVDTTGMTQMNLPDMEFALPAAGSDVEVSAVSLRNLCTYLVIHGDVIQSGHTTDGAGGKKWRALRCLKSSQPPQRAVLRWFAEDMPHPPEVLWPREVAPPPDSSENQQVAAVLNGLEEMIREWQRDLPLVRPRVNAFLQTTSFYALCAVVVQAKSEAACRKATEGAVLIPAFAVIGSSNTKISLRPSLLAGTFDTRVEAIQLAAILADKLGELYGSGEVSDPLDQELQKIVEDDQYVSGRRALLPAAATSGFDIYVFHSLLYRDDAGVGEQPICTVFTAPGPGPKPLFHIPLAVIQGGTPPSLGLGENEARYRSADAGVRPRQGLSRGKIYLIIFAILALIGMISRMTEKKGDPSGSRPDGKKGVLERLKDKLDEKKREHESRP